MHFDGSEIEKTVYGAKATVRTVWRPGRGGWDGILLDPSFVRITVEQAAPDTDCIFYRNGKKVKEARKHTYAVGVPVPSGEIKNIAPAEFF